MPEVFMKISQNVVYWEFKKQRVKKKYKTELKTHYAPPVDREVRNWKKPKRRGLPSPAGSSNRSGLPRRRESTPWPRHRYTSTRLIT